MGYATQWDVFWGDVQKVITRLEMMVREGVPVDGNGEHSTNPHRPLSAGEFLAYRYGDSPACSLSICEMTNDLKTLRFCVAYPWLKEGVPATLEVLDTHKLEDDFEGIVECVNRHAVNISFFDPLFCLNKAQYRTGQKYEFSMAGLAYVLEKIQDTNIRITEGAALEMERQRVLEEDPKADVNQIKFVDISMGDLRCLLPRDDGMDAEFQTVVEEVHFFRTEDVEICKMRVVLMRPAEEPFSAILYASEYVLKGYRPQVGDSIRGALWLQGYPLKPVESSESWVDQVSAESPEHCWEGLDRALAADEMLTREHHGVRALGSSVARLGWDITPYNNPTGAADIPALLVQRGEHQINLWIRAFICGQESERGFTADEIRQFEQECAERGQSAACVTVICTDVGSGYTFKCQGLESLERFTGKVLMTEYIRKPDVPN